MELNCQESHSKCKAQCCAHLVPIEAEVYERNKERATKSFLTIKENLNHVFIETADSKCLFLKENFTCAIYEDRPFLCKKFGDESHLYMTCSFRSKNGKKRSRQESRKIERDRIKLTERFKF